MKFLQVLIRPTRCILPYVENGTITLIGGATTENPSFEIVPFIKNRGFVLNQFTTEEELKRK